MTKRKEILILFISDLLFINLAWTFYYYIRIESGWIVYTNPTPYLIPLIVIYIYWLLLFTLFGLYEYWFVRSRFDEISQVIKAVSIGCFILFFVIFLDDFVNNTKAISRLLILIYWALMILFVGIGRLIIRSIQLNMLAKGIGLRNALIIGNGEKANQLFQLINKSPQLGYKVVGFVSIYENTNNEFLGSLSDLSGIIRDNKINEILIALEQKEKDLLFEIIKLAHPEGVNLKIMPDTYEIISGMVKTNQIYGVPLIEVMPEIMPYSSKIIKRFIDIFISVFLLIINLPLFFITIIFIKLSSPGPILYKQTRIGKNGIPFTLYKFRSMVKNAEEYGPEWAGEHDPRITKIGRIIRKTYFDEIPQLLNVLKNEMSIVGPRPERPYFVELLSKEIPYYYKRLSIKPGITGWSQIKHKYDSSLDDVREKLKYDFYYIENMSLKLDFKILVNTVLVVILMKGH